MDCWWLQEGGGLQCSILCPWCDVLSSYVPSTLDCCWLQAGGGVHYSAQYYVPDVVLQIRASVAASERGHDEKQAIETERVCLCGLFERAPPAPCSRLCKWRVTTGGSSDARWGPSASSSASTASVASPSRTTWWSTSAVTRTTSPSRVRSAARRSSVKTTSSNTGKPGRQHERQSRRH